jgi:aspartate aminotransferase
LAFRQALERLAKDDAKGTHGYMPNAGFADVRDALAKKASADHGVKIDGSRIVMVVGAAGGLNVVLKTILNPQDEIIVVRPYFVEYGAYIANHGGRMVLVDSREDFDLDTQKIAGALTPKTAGIIINSPHNPTGRIYPAATIAALAEALRAHGERVGRYPYLIADEPYREIVYSGATVPPVLSTYGESIVVTSYSKSLSLPGERIGYIALGPEMRDAPEVAGALAYANRVLGYVNAPALMQRIVAELTEAKVDVGIYSRRRDAFKETLDAAGIRYVEPQGAFYLFCKVPGKKGAAAGTPGDDAAFVNHLKDHLILAVPGTGFGAPGWFRMAYCVDESIIRASKPSFVAAMQTW